MKITNSIFTVLFVFLNLIAFAQDRDDAYFDSMAKEACDCSSVLLGYMDDINKLSEEGKVEEIYKLAELIEPESAKMEKCLAELEAKYSDIEANPTYEKRAEEALIRVCPAYARAMQMDGVEIEEMPEPVRPSPSPEPVNPNRDDEYFKAAAIDICECTNGLFDKVSKMELLEAEGKTEELLKLADEVETDVAEMNKCMQILETKYSDIDGNPDYEKRAEDALRQYCPAFAMSLDNEKLAGEEEREEDNLIREEITEQKEEEIIEEEEIEEVVSEEDFYQQTMFDICDCIGSQKGLEEEYRKVAATKDGEKLMAFRMGLQQNYPGMFECLATMNDRVRKLDKDEDSRVKSKAAMIEHCPLFLDLMGLNKD
ncbi:MAG: hypothetical protein ACI94Y_003904 [Maribacter sp.]|jgi:hypothetical protein